MKIDYNRPYNLFDNVNTYQALTAGIRIIVDYIPSSDMMVTRLDVKIENRQYCVALASSFPIAPVSGQKINPTDDLITPSKSVEACLNIKVGKGELIAALKELVSDLENDNKL